MKAGVCASLKRAAAAVYFDASKAAAPLIAGFAGMTLLYSPVIPEGRLRPIQDRKRRWRL